MRSRALLASVLAAAAPAAGQWQATNLTPPGSAGAQIFAVSPTQQAGCIYLSAGARVAATWQSGVPTPLSPARFDAAVFALQGDRQYGLYDYQASIWSGSAPSRVGLGAGAVVAVHGSALVGYTEATNNARAAIWTGAPGGVVDLQPEGVAYSRANATDGQAQGGEVTWNNFIQHAALWHGSAQSFTDLSPASTFASVQAMAPGVQVGYAFMGAHGNAAIWHGSAASATYLRPLGAGGAAFYATTGEVHAGSVTSLGYAHASLYFEPTGQWLDLHPFLPAGFSTSVARAIARQGDTLYIGGEAIDQANHYNAFLWVGTIPSPGAAAPALLHLLLARRRRRPQTLNR